MYRLYCRRIHFKTLIKNAPPCWGAWFRSVAGRSLAPSVGYLPTPRLVIFAPRRKPHQPSRAIPPITATAVTTVVRPVSKSAKAAVIAAAIFCSLDLCRISTPAARQHTKVAGECGYYPTPLFIMPAAMHQRASGISIFTAIQPPLQKASNISAVT